MPKITRHPPNFPDFDFWPPPFSLREKWRARPQKTLANPFRRTASPRAASSSNTLATFGRVVGHNESRRPAAVQDATGSPAAVISEIAKRSEFGALKGRPAHRVRYTCQSWGRARNSLNAVQLETIKKATRRALDRLNQNALAIGLIDVWRTYNFWIAGVELLVCDADIQSIERVFVRGDISIAPVDEPLESHKELLAKAAILKRQSSFDWLKKKTRYHATKEHGQWLAKNPVSSRLMRYGIDRYGNVIEKAPRKTKIKKKPKPVWLEPFAYGSHKIGCACNICENQKNA